MSDNRIPILYLRSHSDSQGADDLIVVDRSPFYVGRRGENQAQIMQPDISGRHAEFRFDGVLWWIVDAKSTNGTFVNGERVAGEHRIEVGDTVHFATKGFQIVAHPDNGAAQNFQTQLMGNSHEIRDLIGLVEVLNENRVYPVYQPIVDLATRQPIGYECLGRAHSKDGPLSPSVLFALASQSKVELRLSASLRNIARHCCECRFCWPGEMGQYLFINMHPTELRDAHFLQSLQELSESDLTSYYRIVVEMPESWVGKSNDMRGLVDQIRQAGMFVAYDDFGTGQSRIPDLIQAPPDFLKLDRQLVAALHEHRIKRSLVKAVVDACTELNVRVIGEGIETEHELQACTEMGISVGQGFLLCKPQPAFQLFQIENHTLPFECPFVRLDIVPPSLRTPVVG